MRIATACILILSLSACSELIGEKGNGVRITEKIKVGDFNRLEISGSFEVILTENNTDEVVIEIDENLLRYIDITVRGTLLEIDSDRRLDSKDGIIIEVPVKKLASLSSSGASSIQTTNPLQSDNININLSGAGKLDLMLDASDVSIEVSGATLVYLEGSAKTFDIEMSGAGSLEASDFEVQDCFVQISGVGNILVNVTGTLDAEVSGLGKVEYIGNPQSVKGDVSGVGNINRKK